MDTKVFRSFALAQAIEILKAKPDIMPQVFVKEDAGKEAAERIIAFTEEIRLYLEKDPQ